MADSELLAAGKSAARYDPRIYWTGMHASHPGRLTAVGYASLGEGFNRAAYVLRRNAVKRLLARNPLPAGPSVLEAGTGTGAYAPVWQGLGASRWVGLDIAEEAVDYCRLHHPEGEFARQDLTAAEWPVSSPVNGEFDLVTAIDVLYHLVDDDAFERAARNLAARVHRGGAVLVSDVFVSGERWTASHVRRRPLAAYAAAFGPAMRLVDREPVFSILADTLPRSRFHLKDNAMLAVWKAMAKTIRRAPTGTRNALGAAAVCLLWPLDALLRRTGGVQGINLELALFQRMR